MDPSTRQTSNGYNIELFSDQRLANQYLCTICEGVCKEPFRIGCEDDHIFCKACLDNYFILTPTNSTKSCPSCTFPNQGLYQNNIEETRHAERVINSLSIKCPLQLQQKKYCNIPFHQYSCLWNGELKDLIKHRNICPLENIICDHCQESMKRYQFIKHDNNCTEKRVSCLQCAMEIKRRLMKIHQNNKCEMTKLSCDDCKENVLRKYMQKHMLNDCPEYEIMCSWNQYGCMYRSERKLMNNHVKQNEMEHLNMKVKVMEKQLKHNKTQSESFKAIIKNHSKELEKVKQANNGLRIEKKDQEIRIKTLETLNDPHNLLLLLSNGAYSTSLQSKKKQKVKIGSFMEESHYRFCIGNNIGFNATKQIGFDAKDVNIIGNDILFGLSENCDTISAVSLDNKICKTFTGDLSVNGCKPIYCNGYGLMVVGGESDDIAKKNIYKIRFNDKLHKFTKQRLTKLPYSTTCPSVCMINDNNDNLFVCGGSWKDKSYGCITFNLSECHLYSFDNESWKQLKSMNYEHQCAGICVWKERGNKIIVGGGFSNIRRVEEYDIHKNKWINLPSLKKKHDYYPALLTSNNILFCVGGVYWDSPNLGSIEFYDPRDRLKEWVYVDMVQNYFNIDQGVGAGYNCYLPL